jgi:hypothetical protein
VEKRLCVIRKPSKFQACSELRGFGFGRLNGYHFAICLREPGSLLSDKKDLEIRSNL